MAKRAHPKPRTIRARRRSPSSGAHASAGQEQQQELSNYELLERRSRELEQERSKGGSGGAQPPDARTPLLYPKAEAAGRSSNATGPERPRRVTSRRGSGT